MNIFLGKYSAVLIHDLKGEPRGKNYKFVNSHNMGKTEEIFFFPIY